MNLSQRAQARQQRLVRRHAAKSDAYDFFNLLTGPALFDHVESLLPNHRERLFPPTETLSMFLAQALSADRSCQQAVDDAAVKRLVGHLPPCSAFTGAYCRARQRLPQAMVSTLALQAGGLVSGTTATPWQWRGRAVRLVDGAILSMPDTPQNQARFPQPSSQKRGLGFPQCRVVVLLCLACGALLAANISACAGKGSDEQTALRALLPDLEDGAVLLGDAYYATYFLLCALVARGIDGVFEQYGARKRSTDFSLGTRLGVRDHLMVLDRPKDKPSWMSQADYDQSPPTLTVREVQTGGKILVTTLLCPNETTKGAIKALYRQRWCVELDLRNIKTTLGMDVLSCKSPDMVEKEIWVYLLAYNLIRFLMAQAALLAGPIPRQLSFKHTVQIWVVWLHRGTATPDGTTLSALLLLIAEQRVGLRPGRVEPRAIKRRPKPFALLTKPRAQARADIRKNGHPKKAK